jgi:hypothetical protein
MVWITEGGTAFHLRPDCEALLAGQDRAERRGQPTHEPENVAHTTARADGRGACLHCFPELIPTDAKPCWVRVDDRWTRGWLLEWFKRDQSPRLCKSRQHQLQNRRKANWIMTPTTSDIEVNTDNYVATEIDTADEHRPDGGEAVLPAVPAALNCS